jgi:epsin
MLYQCTSNENTFAPASMLMEIAEFTNAYDDFTTIFKFTWERLNSKCKEWRRIVKAVTLLEYLCKYGSERCINEIRQEIYKIETLFNFT